MARRSFSEVDCGLAQAAQQVGDKWTLVILRNAFNGMTRFDEFAEHLGVATNVLASRLDALVNAQILRRRKLADDGRAVEYRLTPKGHELFVLIVFLSQWGDRWMGKRRGDRLGLLDRKTQRPLRPVQVQDAEGEAVTARETLYRIGRGGSDVMQRLQAIVARRHAERS